MPKSSVDVDMAGGSAPLDKFESLYYFTEVKFSDEEETGN